MIEELKDNISSKVTERNEISERVNKIVDQIEAMGAQSGTGAKNQQTIFPDSGVNADVDSSSELQKLEERNDEEKKANVQQNLFSSANSGE